MPQLKNLATGQVVNLEGDDAVAALQSGQYVPYGSGDTVELQRPSGNIEEVALTDAPEVANYGSGQTPADPFGRELERLENVREAEFQDEYGGVGGQIRAGIEGAASGLTLGLYDVVADALGMDTEEYARANPDARLGGEIVGMAVPAVFTEGASLGAGAAARGAAEAGKATKLGLALAKTPAGFVTQKAMGIAPKLGGGLKGLAAAHAAEGAAYALVQSTSQMIVSDEPLTAEAVVGELGRSVLFGAGIGAASGAAVAGLGKLGDAAHAAAERRATAAMLDLQSGAGKEVSRTVAAAANDIDVAVDDMVVKHARASGETVVSQAEAKAYSRKGAMLRQFGDDLEVLAVEQAKKAASYGATDSRLASLQGQHKELLELGADVLTDLEAQGMKVQHRALKMRERKLTEAMTRANVDPTPANMQAVDQALGAYRLKLANAGERALGVDVAARLEQIDELRKAATKPLPSGLNRLRRMSDPATGLFNVSEAMSKHRMTADDLLAMAERGEIELRPESGVGLLSPDVAATLPKGPDGWPLSWGRVMQETDPAVGLRQALDNYQATSAAFEGLTEAELHAIVARGNTARVHEYAMAVKNLAAELGVTPSPAMDEIIGGLSSSLAQLHLDRTAGLPSNVSRVALDEARKVAYETFGVSVGERLTDKHVKKLLTMADPAEQVAALKSLDDYYKAAKKFAGDTGNQAHVDAIENSFKAARDTVKASLGALDPGSVDKSSLYAAVGFGALEASGVDDSTPVAEIGMAIALARLAKSSKPGPRSGIHRLARGMVARATARSAGKAAGKHGAFAGGLAASAGYSIGGGIVDTIADARVLGDITGSAVGRITGSFTRKAVSRGPLVAYNVLRDVTFDGPGADEKPPVRNLQEAFRARADELVRVMAAPMAAQARVHEQLAPLRAVHAGVADKVEMLSMQVPAYLYEHMPKDPGVMMRLGKSLWKPSDLDVMRWGEHFKGAFYPVQTLEDAVRPGGSVTPQAAQAVRELYPELFKRFQLELAQRAPELADKLDLRQMTRLSILSDVPIEPSTEPDFVQFVQSQIAERALAAESETPTGSGSSTPPEQPTDAQSLLR